MAAFPQSTVGLGLGLRGTAQVTAVTLRVDLLVHVTVRTGYKELSVMEVYKNIVTVHQIEFQVHTAPKRGADRLVDAPTLHPNSVAGFSS